MEWLTAEAISLPQGQQSILVKIVCFDGQQAANIQTEMLDDYENAGGFIPVHRMEGTEFVFKK